MHLNILSKAQHDQLALLTKFKREFILVGGTAIALHIGHRKSIDFDLFKEKPFNKTKIKQKISTQNYRYQLLYEDAESIHFMIDEVKWTFFYYPFAISDNLQKEKSFKTPDLLTLAAMKAYALGRRAKWKDYVDLYFLMSTWFSFEEVTDRSTEIFGDAFSEKLFRQQLVYFEGIDKSEPVEWIVEQLSEAEIKKGLEDIALI